MNKDTFALVFTGLIVAGFFTAGILDVLDYFIVKVLLFIAFAALVVYVLIVVIKDSENKNHLK